ncbi:MAG: hypothetical protein IJF02_00010 [Oscillospiraceae bacterium]|nr:hypothetical protein [Oscillospiraceae bacterium]
MRIKTILLVLLLVSLLTGCTLDSSAYMQNPISLSGDTAYYATMDPDLRKTALDMKHIEVSGIVSAGGYTTIFVGDEKQDSICFSCTFSQQRDEITAIKEGDTVQLHGVCTGIVGNIIYLEHCLLTQSRAPTQTRPFIPPTTMPAVPNTPEGSVSPTTVPPTPLPTVPPTAVVTNPPATAPRATEPSIAPTTSEGTEDMVWIPQSGKKYHIKPNCSGMKNPAQVTIEEAQTMGYTPCKKCYS